jgi:hypothetical protein
MLKAEPTDGFLTLKPAQAKKGWVGATYLGMEMPQPTAEFAAPFSATTGCDAIPRTLADQ